MSSIYGTYKGWYLPGFESDESLEHKKIEQQMDETETSASNKEAYAFKYTGQTVDKAFVGKVTQLLVGNGIPNFLFGDMMFRFFGCETDVLSINISIPDELMDEAVRVLRQAGFYDGPVEPFEVEEAQCVQEFQIRQEQQPFLAWGCRYLDDHEYHRNVGAWWLPTHVFHLNQTPGKLGHVDLSLFTHSHYFWDLPAPTLAPDEDARSSYVLSTDRRLPEPVCFGPSRHAVKMISPARLVEALILLAYRDIHVPSQITFSDWHDDLFVIFKMVSGWEWPEDDPTFDGYSQFTEAEPHGWQFSLDGQRLRMRSKVTGLDPRWLRLAAFQPLFQKYFEDLFETVLLPRESYLRTPSPENTLSEEEQRKEFAEWDKLLIENEEELAEWEKRIQEDQPAVDDAYEACDKMPDVDWEEAGERAFEAEDSAYQIRCLRAGRVMVGPGVLESRDGKVMDDFARRLAEAWLLPESPFDAFNPKIKRLEPDVPTTWTLRDEFR